MTRILLVNPPIYDFTAYDFWLKPLGMLTAAARFWDADIELFDFLDRMHPSVDKELIKKTDEFDRGPYPREKVEKSPVFHTIPRYFYRFGLHKSIFEQFLQNHPPFDVVFIQTVMTYWYPGYQEIIDTIRAISPDTKIAAGGFYASLLPDHARSIGVNFVIQDNDLSPLNNYITVTNKDTYRPPLWNLYSKISSAAIQLTTGCPYQCTYCAIGQRNIPFIPRPLDEVIADLQAVRHAGATHIAFYDDALLYKPGEILIPFLEHIIQNQIQLNLHTPNALHARMLTPQLAELLVNAGTKTFYLGFESSSENFQSQTGGKVKNTDLARAVQSLKDAGAKTENITAYEILAHPQDDMQRLEESIRYVHSLGIRVMLSDFSPIPGTPDGELARKWVNLDEPLTHNKTYFPIIKMGFDKSNRYKDLVRKLNNSL